MKRIAILTVVAVAVSMVLPFGGTAEALPAGCPPHSSICNPAGMAILAEFGTGTAAASGVTATAATVTTGTVASNVITATGGAVAVTATGMVAWSLLAGDERPPELYFSEGEPAGWVDGLNSVQIAQSTSVEWVRYTFEIDMEQAPHYGETSSIPLIIYFEYGHVPASRPSPIANWHDTSNRTFRTWKLDDNFGGLLDLVAAYVWPVGWAQPRQSVGVTISPNGPLQRAGFRSGTTEYLTWYPFGHSNFEEGIPSNQGILTSTIECYDYTAETYRFASQSLSIVFGTNEVIDAPSPSCAAGEILTGFGVTWDGGDGIQDIVPWTEQPQWVHDLPVEWPSCVIPGSCELQLWRIFSDSPALYCGVAAVGCPEWWSASNKLDHYECKFGPYTVDLGYCNVFRNPGTITPNTPYQTDPKNGVRHSAGADPDTSLELPLDAYQPEPGPIWPPNPGPLPIPQPGAEITTGHCFPQGWGLFNPVEWVFRPVACALQWAFVPRPQVVNTQLGSGTEALRTTFPFSIVYPIPGAIIGVFDGLSGEACDSLPDFDPQQLGRLQLPCDPIIDGYSHAYDFMRLSVWLSAAFTSWVIVTRGFGNKDDKAA